MTDKQTTKADTQAVKTQPIELRDDQLDQPQGGSGDGDRYNGVYFLQGVSHAYSHSGGD